MHRIINRERGGGASREEEAPPRWTKFNAKLDVDSNVAKEQ